MVINKEEYLRIYAKTYIERNAKYLSSIVFYSRQSIYPEMMEKHSFIDYLNNKFFEQNLTIDRFYGIIELVMDENDELLLYLNSCNQDTLISIEIHGSLITRIDALKTNSRNIKKIEVLFNKQNEYNKSIKYTPTGYIIIDKSNDPNDIMDIIINTNYKREYCSVFSYDNTFIADLMNAGFIIMMKKINDGTVAIKATHHNLRSVLEFKNLHIGKTIKKYLHKYELKFNCDFEFIVNRCYEIYGDNWLTKSLIETINIIRNQNIGNVKPVSFGVYRNGVLQAGEFGIISGENYTSYSGYHDENNAGKVQMILTSQYLENNGFSFYDLGMPLKYKTELGAKNIEIKLFIEKYRKYN